MTSRSIREAHVARSREAAKSGRKRRGVSRPRHARRGHIGTCIGDRAIGGLHALIGDRHLDVGDRDRVVAHHGVTCGAVGGSCGREPAAPDRGEHRPDERAHGSQVRSLGTIPNDTEAIAKLVKKPGEREKLAFCYEAGPTGYVLYWQLVKQGLSCVVVAPT